MYVLRSAKHPPALAYEGHACGETFARVGNSNTFVAYRHDYPHEGKTLYTLTNDEDTIECMGAYHEKTDLTPSGISLQIRPAVEFI